MDKHEDERRRVCNLLRKRVYYNIGGRKHWRKSKILIVFVFLFLGECPFVSNVIINMCVKKMYFCKS